MRKGPDCLFEKGLPSRNRAPRSKLSRTDILVCHYIFRRNASPTLCCERGSTTAAPSCVRVRKREAGSHHAGDVIDLDAVQILTAKHIDEKFHSALVQNEIALARILFNIQAVLETRTAAWDDAYAKSGSFRQTLFAGHKLLDLDNRAVGDVKRHGRGGGWCASGS